VWSDVLVVTGTRTVMCLQCIKACDKLLYCTTVQHGFKDVTCCSWVLKSYLFDAHTHNRLRPLIRDNPGRPVPEETLTHSHPSWSSSSIYNDQWHPLCSFYVLDSPLVRPLSRSSLVFLLVLDPQLHTPYISSPNCHLFVAHAHTNQHSLFCCNTNAMSSIPSLSLNSLLVF